MILNPRYDSSVWQKAARDFRGLYRRLFYPNGPKWWSRRIGSENLIRALRGCSVEEAAKEQQLLDQSFMHTWFKGF